MSCIQCFELIQSGRTFERDLLIISTKFSNQQLRFAKWGEACGFSSNAGFDERLLEPRLRGNIEQTLYCVEEVLKNGVAIIRSYKELATETVVSVQSSRSRWSWTVIKARLRRSSKDSHLKNAAKWAISDKKKLDEIVKHLYDLVGDLERLTRDFGVVQRQRILVQYEIESISDTSLLEVIEESRMSSNDIVSDAASVHLSSLKSFARRTGNGTSMSGTEPTNQSYHTAPEPIDQPNMSAVRVPADEFAMFHEANQEDISDLWKRDVNPPQNRRIMHDLSARTRPYSAPSPVRNLYSSKTGTLIRAMRTLEEFDETIDLLSAKHSRYLDIKPHLYPAKRINRELADYQRENDHIGTLERWQWYKLHPIAGNTRLILCSFEGPPSSPYEGGVFHLVLGILDDYPWIPPLCRAITRIYHPNVSPTGEVCISLFQDDWGTFFTLRTLMISIASILDDPETEDPLVPEIAVLYRQNRTEYEENAKSYTKKYAKLAGLFSKDGMDHCFQVCVDLVEEIRRRQSAVLI